VIALITSLISIELRDTKTWIPSKPTPKMLSSLWLTLAWPFMLEWHGHLGGKDIQQRRFLVALLWLGPSQMDLTQVVVGHWMWEGNQPNVAHPSDVSYLAMCVPLYFLRGVPKHECFESIKSQ
jgi:hypothetical protein